jgi:hypothetical protein
MHLLSVRRSGTLRPGNVHSADGWEGVLKPVLARYRGKVSRLYFRADAGFANPEVYGYLEDEGIKYAIRLPANRVLQKRIGYLLKRPVSRQPARDLRTVVREGKGAIRLTRLSCRSFAANAVRLQLSCARLQSRQLPAHIGDAGADQGLVADVLEGQTDQNRR